MAVEAAELQIRQVLDGFGDGGALPPVAAETGHARVQFQLHLEAAAAAVSQGCTETRLLQAAQCRHQLPVQAAAQIFRLDEIAQQQHRGIDARPSQGDPLLQGGDAEACRSAAQGSSRHGFGPVTVSVRFHHRHQRGPAGQMSEQCPRIGLDGGG